MTVPGVILSGVPGAGGFDSIFAICVDEEGVTVGVEAVWQQWNEITVLPVAVTDDREGLREEE